LIPELNEYLDEEQTLPIPTFLKKNISIESVGPLLNVEPCNIDEKIFTYRDSFFKNPSFPNHYPIFYSERQSLQISLNANRMDTEKALE
jgi:hypothetical protein